MTKMKDKDKKELKRAGVLLVWLVAIFALTWLLTGCGGRQCIRVGGEYMESGGSVEYCWDAEESKNSGLPAFSGAAGEGKNYLIPEEDIEEAVKMIEEKLVSMKSTT